MNGRTRRHARPWIALAGAAFALIASSANAEEVATRFAVEADTFIQNLDAGRAEVERATTDALIDAAHRYFPLVRWQAVTSPDARATLTLALTERPAARLPTVLLTWRATADGTALAMPELPPIELYSTLNMNRETHDPAALAGLLRTTLDTWFANEANRRLFQRGVLRNIPLARRVDVDANAQRILLPFSLASLKMDRESQLRVRVEIDDPTGVARNGDLDVSTLIEGPARGGLPATLGTVTKFSVSDAPAVSGWSPTIPALFAQQNRTRVFVELYIYAEAPTVNGNFVQP